LSSARIGNRPSKSHSTALDLHIDVVAIAFGEIVAVPRPKLPKECQEHTIVEWSDGRFQPLRRQQTALVLIIGQIAMPVTTPIFARI
jgi:hypothetical protein